MRLGILRKPKALVTISILLGWLTCIPSAVADMTSKEWHYAQILDGLSASKQGDSSSKQVQHTRPDVQLDWTRVMSQASDWVHIEYHENSHDYVSRVIEQMKVFLTAFENTYDVHVVWKDRFNTRTDMTTVFTRFVHLTRAVKDMSIYPEIFLKAMELFNENVSTSQLIGYGEDINKTPQEQLPYINGWVGGDTLSDAFPFFSPAQLASCRNRVHVNWNKIIPQVNTWVLVRCLEDAGDYLSRVEEKIKLFLTSFEDAYGVHVFWEDFDRPYPEVTLKFSGFVILVQALKATLSDKITLQEITQLFKKKNSAERGA